MSETYFESEHLFYLEEIKYTKYFDEDTNNEDATLNCTDETTAKYLGENKIKITYKRSLAFDTEKLFYLTVSFGADLRIKKNFVEKFNWEQTNILDKIRDCDYGVFLNLSSRSSLLISQITASYGQSPIVTPPNNLHLAPPNSSIE